jgi:hypothetical protein
MIMFDQHERLARPAVGGARQRRIVLGTAALIALVTAVVVLAIALGVDAPKPLRAGCVSGTVAGVLGGSMIVDCGRQARELCNQPASGGVVLPASLLAECRKDHYLR